MFKKIGFVLLLPLLALITSCGINPPTEDLNLAKAALSKAEEAKADQFAQTEYQKSKDTLSEGEKNMVKKKDKKNEAAKKKFTEAKASADAAYKKAAPLYAEFSINNAKQVKQSADDIKANVAVKDQYEQAKALYDESITDSAAGKYESSWDKAIKSKTLFDEVFKITTEKKANADDAIQGAQQSIQNAESK